MSEHHRAAWGSREDAVWWPSGISPREQEILQHHQQLINQHHQFAQQQAQLQHQAAVQQQQQQLNDSARNHGTTSATQQQFSYKIAHSVQNSVTTVSTSNAPYDFRLGMTAAGARPGDPPTMSSAAPSTLWWNPAGQNAPDNSLQQQQPHHQNQSHVQQNNAVPNKMVVVAGNVAGAKVKDNKPRGPISAYSFFVQTCREEHKKKYPEGQIIMAEFSRQCTERWKTALAQERQRFHEMAEKDKQRYKLEMQSYVPPEGAVVGRAKKRKHFKDPNAPKRPLSTFFWFCHDERNKVKALNPKYSVGDIAKELGRMWSALDPKIKQKYEQMAEKDKQRYEQEMREYMLKCKNEQGGETPAGLNLPQELQQAGLQHLPPQVQQVVEAVQLQAQHVVQAHPAAAAAAAAAVQHQLSDDDDDEEDDEEDDDE